MCGSVCSCRPASWHSHHSAQQPVWMLHTAAAAAARAAAAAEAAGCAQAMARQHAVSVLAFELVLMRGPQPCGCLHCRAAAARVCCCMHCCRAAVAAGSISAGVDVAVQGSRASPLLGLAAESS
eukprot:1150479-Pelagomonas_calceolata.AAC.6